MPQWLTGQIEDWPVIPEDLPTPESSFEKKKSTSAMLVAMKGKTGVTALVNPNDYSKLQRLVCLVAWVRRFVNNLKVGLERKENTKRSGKLEARELNEAEIELIKSTQLRRIKEAGQLQTTGE